ncbi:MAG: cellulose synthase family protein [Akkermansiaceae bacterium]
MNNDTASWIYYVLYTAVLLGLAGYGFHRLTTLYLYFKYRNDMPTPKKKWDDMPLVTVQLPVFNEMHVVDRLLDAVAALDYPQDKLQIQILDDSTDETVEISKAGAARLREQGFNAECIHRTDRTGFKAGALENGMKSAQGEYILILDADFVPNADLLQKTMHYFTDEKCALVQTRWGHLNRNYNALTRVQALFLDGHLEIEQTTRNRSGRFFTFNGTGGIWRKSAIVDAGGWEHDTLTEDMDLSYRAQLKGWEFIFLREVETPAELPVDMAGFKNQQHRWTKGSIQCCKKCLMNIWKSNYNLGIKLEATAHLTSNFAYLLLIALCFLIFPKNNWGPQLDFWERLIVDLPIFFFASCSVIIFYTVAQKALHPKTWLKEICYLPLLLALGIGMAVNNAKAVLEAIVGHETGFVRTPKYGIQGEKKMEIKKSRYKALKSLTPIFELCFALFFTYVVLDAAWAGNWPSAILLLPFPVGFFYTSMNSLKQMVSFGQLVPAFLKHN